VKFKICLLPDMPPSSNKNTKKLEIVQKGDKFYQEVNDVIQITKTFNSFFRGRIKEVAVSFSLMSDAGIKMCIQI